MTGEEDDEVNVGRIRAVNYSFHQFWLFLPDYFGSKNYSVALHVQIMSINPQIITTFTESHCFQHIVYFVAHLP